jgi:hypothetical protein
MSEDYTRLHREGGHAGATNPRCPLCNPDKSLWDAFEQGRGAGRAEQFIPPGALAHGDGEPHRYRIECEVCGQRGTVNLSIEPQTAAVHLRRAAMSEPRREDALRDLLEEATNGPWRREDHIVPDDENATWLINDAGDSLRINADDAALLINAALAAATSQVPAEVSRPEVDEPKWPDDLAPITDHRTIGALMAREEWAYQKGLAASTAAAATGAKPDLLDADLLATMRDNAEAIVADAHSLLARLAASKEERP